MIVITDSNIIISALMRPNGTTAKIFKAKSRIQFLAPSFMMQEIKNHFEKIVKISDLPRSQILNEYTFLKSKIKVVEVVKIPKKHIETAKQIVYGIDCDDLFFIALNRFKKHKIWTLDKKLIKGVTAKGYNIFVTTKELSENLYK